MTSASSETANPQRLGALIERSDSSGGGNSLKAMGLRSRAVVVVLVFVFFFGCLGMWSSWAPLRSGAVAKGVISVSGKRKTVQHLEGGIVTEILVREGDKVGAGDVLVRLSGTQPETQIQLLWGQLAAAAAKEARLQAERDKADTVAFPDEIGSLSGGNNAEYRKIIDGQRAIFAARREFFRNQEALTNQRVIQLNEEIRGIRAEIRSLKGQLALIKEEINDLDKLVDKGFARKPRLLELRRQAFQIEGRRDQNRTRVARARQTIVEARLDLNETRTRLWNETVTELRDTQVKIADFRDRIIAAKDVLSRIDVRAPVAGRIVDLRIFTNGGVIAPGAPIMDIVPGAERLEIEARVDPIDIDVVRAGLEAEVRLTAYRSDEVPIIKGVVENVSADSLVDKVTGQSYYQARVIITEDLKLPGRKPLRPGMPAEVLIVTGERTVMSYLLDPIARSLSRALRESTLR